METLDKEAVAAKQKLLSHKWSHGRLIMFLKGSWKIEVEMIMIWPATSLR